MPTGHCLCGAIKMNVSGDPMAVVGLISIYPLLATTNSRVLQGVCHCLDCRKTSGSTFATNWFIPEHQFSLEGVPKTFDTTADSGAIVTSHFCGNCGITMYRSGSGMPGIMFVKAGVFDDPDVLNSFKPQGEIFVSKRAAWLAPISGASQKEKMV